MFGIYLLWNPLRQVDTPMMYTIPERPKLASLGMGLLAYVGATCGCCHSLLEALKGDS